MRRFVYWAVFQNPVDDMGWWRIPVSGCVKLSGLSQFYHEAINGCDRRKWPESEDKDDGLWMCWPTSVYRLRKWGNIYFIPSLRYLTGLSFFISGVINRQICLHWTILPAETLSLSVKFHRTWQTELASSCSNMSPQRGEAQPDTWTCMFLPTNTS